MRSAQRRSQSVAGIHFEPVTDGVVSCGTAAARSVVEKNALLTVVRRFFRGHRIMNGANNPTWFASMTFRRAATTPLIASSSLKSWLSKLNRRNPESRVSAVCWSVELQRRGTAHLHALMAGGSSPLLGHCDKCLTTDLRAFYVLNESWFHHHGVARFRPYDDRLGGGCAAYVLKYILSDENEGWGLWEAGRDY